MFLSSCTTAQLHELVVNMTWIDQGLRSAFFKELTRGQKHPVSETLCFLVFTIPEKQEMSGVMESISYHLELINICMLYSKGLKLGISWKTIFFLLKMVQKMGIFRFFCEL
jgi:hypothetical protein